jgi:hypothetical protein
MVRSDVMKLRMLCLVCCAVLFQALVPAQTAQAPAPADPVSGNWGADGATFLELKYDGTAAVTGTAIWRGDGREPRRTPIAKGRFDPMTGALTLEGEAIGPDGATHRYLIEGTVTGEKMTGTYSVGGEKGAFTFARQAGAPRTADQLAASYEAHRGDFDYLLGDWAFTVDSKEHGKGRGFWSAVRLADGQILDEYRIVGDQGETYYVTTSLRNYNRAQERWELIGADAGGGLQDFGTARRVGAEIHIEQTFGVTSGMPSLWKIRYYDIRPDRFSWTADRSNDNGKTWEKDHQRIEARRIGPPRTLEPLAPARKAP